MTCGCAFAYKTAAPPFTMSRTHFCNKQMVFKCNPISGQFIALCDLHYYTVSIRCWLVDQRWKPLPPPPSPFCLHRIFSYSTGTPSVIQMNWFCVCCCGRWFSFCSDVVNQLILMTNIPYLDNQIWQNGSGLAGRRSIRQAEVVVVGSNHADSYILRRVSSISTSSSSKNQSSSHSLRSSTYPNTVQTVSDS